jgi:hypothetical protein
MTAKNNQQNADQVRLAGDANAWVGRLIGPAFSAHSYLRDLVLPTEGKGAVKGARDLRSLLEAIAGEYLADRSSDGSLRPDTWFDDLVYYLPTPEEVDQVLRAWQTPYPDYVKHVFDCDDYAYSTKLNFSLYRLQDRSRQGELTPFACGMVWGLNLPTLGSGAHAVNLVVVADGPRADPRVLLIDATPGSKLVTPLPASRAGMTFNYIVI